MELPAINLPSTKGARLRITAKSFGNISKAAEDAAAILRAEAQSGTSHPRAVIDSYAKSAADLDAIRAATESEIAVIDEAIAILNGENTLGSQHPLLMTVAEMKFTADAFKHSTVDLAKDKATGLTEETRNQLKACREAARRAMDDHDHRLDAIRNKHADALRAAIATYTGPYRVSLKEVGDLLQIPGIPDDSTPLPAPDFDPRLPADHPARTAAVLHVIAKSREAEAELARQYQAAKRAKAAKPRQVIDDVRDELALLGGN